MKLLLDTHTFIWFIEGNPLLSERAKSLIEDVENERLLSMVSLWEMAIKLSRGKLYLAIPFRDLIAQQLSMNDIGLLNIKTAHVEMVSTLPFFRIDNEEHKDPFDRLIIAQSMTENVPVVSVDGKFDTYQVERLW